MFKTNSFEEIIEKIRRKPALYLGRNTVSALSAFLDGWFLRDPESVVDAKMLERYTDWIRCRFGIKENVSWDRLLLLIAIDEHDALNLFFKTFDDFLQEHRLRSNSTDAESPKDSSSKIIIENKNASS